MEPVVHAPFKDRARSLQDRLKHLFKGGFTAMDIAEPLICFDADSPATEMLSILHKRDIPVAGILHQGTFLGIVAKGPPVDGRCREVVQTVGMECMLAHSASYQDVLRCWSDRKCSLSLFWGKWPGLFREKIRRNLQCGCGYWA